MKKKVQNANYSIDHSNKISYTNNSGDSRDVAMVEMIQTLSKKVSENFKLIIALACVLWAGFSFLYRLQELSPRIDKVENRCIALETRLTTAENNFNITTTKIDTTLTRISTDLQYIKQKMIDKAF